MLVEIHNDGPVTIIIDSRERLESRHRGNDQEARDNSQR
jgi:hypothetical protein